MVARAPLTGSTPTRCGGLGAPACVSCLQLQQRLEHLESARLRLAVALDLPVVVSTASLAAASLALSQPRAAIVRPKRREPRFDPLPTAWTRIPIEPRFKWKDL